MASLNLGTRRVISSDGTWLVRQAGNRWQVCDYAPSAFGLWVPRHTDHATVNAALLAAEPDVVDLGRDVELVLNAPCDTCHHELEANGSCSECDDLVDLSKEID